MWLLRGVLRAAAGEARISCTEWEGERVCRREEALEACISWVEGGSKIGDVRGRNGATAPLPPRKIGDLGWWPQRTTTKPEGTGPEVQVSRLGLDSASERRA